MTSLTKQTMTDQFAYWRRAPRVEPLEKVSGQEYVIVGCGTSYNLAMALAAAFNEQGLAATPVPGGEWVARRQSYKADARVVTVIALSRSGETTETVQAAAMSKDAGMRVIGITCAPDSSLAKASTVEIYAETDPREGIVMTTSASLMLLEGLRLAGVEIGDDVAAAAEAMLAQMLQAGDALLRGQTQFVYLGGGALYGVAVEGALKLQEMSLSHTQAFHPLEYRHGPISLVDDKTSVVMLYHPDTRDAEALLVQELQAKGARVIGLGGPGDISFPVDAGAEQLGLIYLPTLQMIGEMVAADKNIDTASPRHLTKVVMLV